MKGDFEREIREYLYSKEEVVAGYIFGSRAAGRARSKSDFDIAVLLSSGVDRKEYGRIKLSIINDLMLRLSCDGIDVVILNTASPLLAHEVIKKGVLLCSKDDAQRIQYVVAATKRYLDTIYLRAVQDRILHEKIRRGTFGHFEGSHKYSIAKVRKSAPGTPAVT